MPWLESVRTRTACKACALFVSLFVFVSFALPSHAGDSAVTARHGMVVAQEMRAAEAGAETLPNVAIEAEADKNMLIGGYYVDRGNYTSALARFKTVVTRYRSSQRVAEALARLTKVYLTLGIPSEAKTAAAVLAREFPNSPWSAMAQEVVRSAGLEPLEKPQ